MEITGQKEAEPRFSITAESISRIVFDEPDKSRVIGSETDLVLVVVENLSTEPATLNHAQVAVKGDMGLRGPAGTASNLFPIRLEPRGQISWEIRGDEFDGWLEFLIPLVETVNHVSNSQFMSAWIHGRIPKHLVSGTPSNSLYVGLLNTKIKREDVDVTATRTQLPGPAGIISSD